MDKNLVIYHNYIEDFIKKLTKNRYIAIWLGFFIPQLYDLREYALSQPLLINHKFLNLLFPENLVELYEKNLDEKISGELLADLVTYVLKDYENIDKYFHNKGEKFYLEIGFQMPFVSKGRLKKEEIKQIFEDVKDRYLATFRKNLTGSIIITNDKHNILIERESKIIEIVIKNLKEEQKAFKVYLKIPISLEKYWHIFLKNL